MRVGREGRPRSVDDRPPLLLTGFTGLELTTFTVSVWPLVPGFSWSTLINTGFLFAVAVLVVAGVAMVWKLRNLESSFCFRVSTLQGTKEDQPVFGK